VLMTSGRRCARGCWRAWALEVVRGALVACRTAYCRIEGRGVRAVGARRAGASNVGLPRQDGVGPTFDDRKLPEPLPPDSRHRLSPTMQRDVARSIAGGGLRRVWAPTRGGSATGC
jgi:hypothetical protein